MNRANTHRMRIVVVGDRNAIAITGNQTSVDPSHFKRYAKIELAGEPVWNSNLEFRSLKSLPLRVTAA